MTKSTWMRWGVCALCVLAMIALLGGCSKKEKTAEKAEDNAENAEKSGMTSQNMAMAGTYSASMANGTASLMLNADMTASFSMKPMADAPAQVENGTWANGAAANEVAVTFSKSPMDSTMSMTLNFSATADTLMLTNGETVGMGGLKLVKQQ
jgi:hypothetical protein